MKKIITIILAAFCVSAAVAQSSRIADLLSFTAVARDMNGNALQGQNIYVQIRIYTGNPNGGGGVLEYCEVPSALTNSFGEFSMTFGSNPNLLCSPFKLLSLVPWETGDKWVDIQYQPSPGSAFVHVATFKLGTVPYAFSSRTAEQTEGIITAGAVSGQILQYNGQNFHPASLNPQAISVNPPLMGNGTSSSPVGLVAGNSSGQVLKWNGTSWSPGTDNTGAGVPIGTIISFGGPSNKVPNGWFLCDGATVSRSTFSDLFGVIGNNWGGGDGISTFHLPDLRGQFLRGVSGTSSADPDKNSRTALFSGGATGNNPGTYQNDEFKSHQHNTTFKDQNNNWAGGGNVNSQVFSSGSKNTAAAGGTETRPKNAYVNYIIKY